jgi:hypothetical protein
MWIILCYIIICISIMVCLFMIYIYIRAHEFTLVYDIYSSTWVHPFLWYIYSSTWVHPCLWYIYSSTWVHSCLWYIYIRAHEFTLAYDIYSNTCVHPCLWYIFEHMSSPFGLNLVCVAHFLVFCVVFCRSLLACLPFSFGHCIVSP